MLAHSVVELQVPTLDTDPGAEPVDHGHVLRVGSGVGIGSALDVVGDVLVGERWRLIDDAGGAHAGYAHQFVGDAAKRGGTTVASVLSMEHSSVGHARGRC
jgi:hypothetical protein